METELNVWSRGPAVRQHQMTFGPPPWQGGTKCSVSEAKALKANSHEAIDCEKKSEGDTKRQNNSVTRSKVRPSQPSYIMLHFVEIATEPM